MALEVQFRDSHLTGATIVGSNLVLTFDFMIVDETNPADEGKLVPGLMTLQNYFCRKLPMAEMVSRLHIHFGESSYMDTAPIELVLQEPCEVFVEQDGHQALIKADGVKIEVRLSEQS